MLIISEFFFRKSVVHCVNLWCMTVHYLWSWFCFHEVWGYRVVPPDHLLSTWCCAHDQISHAILPSILVYHKLCNTGGGMKTLEWDQYYTCTNTCMSVVILWQSTSSHSVSSKLVSCSDPRRGIGVWLQYDIPPDPLNQHTIVSDHVLTYAIYGILPMPRDHNAELITLSVLWLVISHARHTSLGQAGCRIVTRPLFSVRVGSGTRLVQSESV